MNTDEPKTSIPARKKSLLSRRAFIRMGALSVPALCILDGFALEPSLVKTRNVGLSSPHSLRIVHFTDIHYVGDRKHLGKIVGQINALKPDICCFTGDIVEHTGHLEEALEMLSEIESPLYGVPGNHEYWAGADFAKIAPAFEHTGGKWLADDKISACGGKAMIHGSTDTRPVEMSSDKAAKQILLTHYPASADSQKNKFDLILAGHSHGGQVRIPFIGPPLLPDRVGKYSMGLYQTPGGPLYVNPGIGTWLIPVRFNCRPEITVIEI